jgi:hypothetical protein
LQIQLTIVANTVKQQILMIFIFGGEGKN